MAYFDSIINLRGNDASMISFIGENPSKPTTSRALKAREGAHDG
jgi:hypothetical protein